MKKSFVSMKKPPFNPARGSRRPGLPVLDSPSGWNKNISGKAL
jgi:hypothetical protein